MIRRTILEWQSLGYSEDRARIDAIPAHLADRLVAVARHSSLGGEGGARILHHGRDRIRAGGIIGIIAAEGCTLEILPKIDGLGPTGDPGPLRRELVHMLSVALDIEIATGTLTDLDWQRDTILEVLIKLFCTKLFEAVHRGLPQRHIRHEEDLPTLRGQLDVVRQFTTLTVAPQKLACRFDALSPDIALNRIMKAAVGRLMHVARSPGNQRGLRELSLAFADISDVPIPSLRWDEAIIDRTNGRWGELKRLAHLLLGERFQTTSHGATHGHALLFEMNVLFEEYIGRMLVRALAGQPVSVRRQGGGRYCLVELDNLGSDGALRFRTRPDLILSRDGQVALIIDTKWKRLSSRIDDPKQGISQSDIYQMMAYSRLYGCPRVMLLYPHHDGLPHDDGVANQHRIGGGSERLQIATIRLGQRATLPARLHAITREPSQNAIICEEGGSG